MRPWGSLRLRRRMHEIERALTATVGVLVLLLVVTSISTLEADRRQYIVESISVAEPKSRQNIETVHSVEEPSARKHGILDKEQPDEEDLMTDDPDLFLPGSLSDMDRTTVLHQCYVPSKVRLPLGQGCSISKKYKVIFHMTPKSGSSTGRHVIKNDFDGEDHHSEAACRPPDSDTYVQVAVLRNPTTRAFAAYEEMFVRRLGKPELIPLRYRAFMEPFRGWVYKNYSALFDTVEGVRKLNDAYEQFMEVWDGDAFDMHLESQVPYNMRRAPGKSRHSSSHLTLVFDTHAMEESFTYLAKMVNLDKTPKVIRGRAYPRRLNVSHVSEDAFQAMCRIYKEDFCCLNYKLPTACTLPSIPKGKRVRCKWVEVDGERLIQAVLV